MLQIWEVGAVGRKLAGEVAALEDSAKTINAICCVTH
jgi:hypothetical protein